MNEDTIGYDPESDPNNPAFADDYEGERPDLTGDLAHDVPILRDDAGRCADMTPQQAYWLGLSAGSAIGFSIARPGPFARKANEPMSFQAIDFWKACHSEAKRAALPQEGEG